MTRAARLINASLLAGLALIFPPGEVRAENSVWTFEKVTDPLTDVDSGTAVSTHSNGGHIGFICDRGDQKDDLLAFGATIEFDRYAEDKAEVAWRIDNGTIREEIWDTNPGRSGNGVAIVGREAYEFALAVAQAQTRLVFRNPNGTAVFNAKGSTSAISQMLKLCGLVE